MPFKQLNQKSLDESPIKDDNNLDSSAKEIFKNG